MWICRCLHGHPARRVKNHTPPMRSRGCGRRLAHVEFLDFPNAIQRRTLRQEATLIEGLIQRHTHHRDQEETRQHYRAAMQNRRSEEHTSELQSQSNLVCRLLLEKKK